MGVRTLDSVSINPSLPAKVTTMGNIVEIMVSDGGKSENVIQKIDNDFYLDKRTGEIKEFCHMETRADDTRSIRKTLKRIRDLINTNVVVAENCIWETFTYRFQNGFPMTDTKRLYDDYKKFFQKFKRYCVKMGWDIPEYICVAEPQGNKAWHLHIFFIWSHKAPFIPNDVDTVQKMGLNANTVTMSDLWGQGFTKTKSLKDCDNIGAYFSAYLGDMSVEEVKQLSSIEQSLAYHAYGDNTQINDKVVDGQEKKFVKGGRLFLYPPKFNILRHSKGIKEPEIEMMSQDMAKEKVRGGTRTFSKCYDILDDFDNHIKYISKEYYNTKRKKVQD